jgi:ribosomal-protein-alanine N-acetyltransferase
VHSDVQETLADMHKRMPEPGRDYRKAYAILLRPDSESEGNAESEPRKPKMIGIVGTRNELEIAYKLNERYWRKGYMSEAIAMFLKLFWSLEGR